MKKETAREDANQLLEFYGRESSQAHPGTSKLQDPSKPQPDVFEPILKPVELSDTANTTQQQVNPINVAIESSFQQKLRNLAKSFGRNRDNQASSPPSKPVSVPQQEQPLKQVDPKNLPKIVELKVLNQAEKESASQRPSKASLHLNLEKMHNNND